MNFFMNLIPWLELCLQSQLDLPRAIDLRQDPAERPWLLRTARRRELRRIEGVGRLCANLELPGLAGETLRNLVAEAHRHVVGALGASGGLRQLGKSRRKPASSASGSFSSK